MIALYAYQGEIDFPFSEDRKQDILDRYASDPAVLAYAAKISGAVLRNRYLTGVAGGIKVRALSAVQAATDGGTVEDARVALAAIQEKMTQDITAVLGDA
jgi:hypothetical protein